MPIHAHCHYAIAAFTSTLAPATQPSRWAVLLAAVLLGPVAADAHAQQDVEVREQDGLLTVQAKTSARHLAEVLSEQLGINFVVTGDAESLVNIDIIEEPLDKALAKLSPNHMLVRNDVNPDSKIVEVVLMMGEDGGSSSTAGGDQFLPSGSPADDVAVVEEQAFPEDGGELRDPNRSLMVREAAEAAANDASGLNDGTQSEYPAPESFDPVTGLPIDPNTGLPIE